MPQKKRVRRSSDGKTITFQIDDKARAALERLEAAAPSAVLRGRSAIIRSALMEAAERLDPRPDDDLEALKRVMATMSSGYGKGPKWLRRNKRRG